MGKRIYVALAALALSAVVPLVASGAASKATRATFAGSWGGHERLLAIGHKGRAKETIYDGCCDHVIDLRFRISHIRGTSTRATARARVTAVHVYDHKAYSKSNPPPHVGERGRLRLRHGIIHEPFTETTYCDRAAELKSRCGA